MYRLPEAQERLGFGDVLAGDWLFDLYLRHDAVPLSRQQRDSRTAWFENRGVVGDRDTGKDAVLSHADAALGFGSRRLAVVVTDDCELESMQVRRNTSGRILLAAIRPAPEAEIEDALRRNTYRRFALPADTSMGFAGGIVEFQRLFAVYLPSLTQQPASHTRVLSLDPEAQGRLSVSLCAHVTRHGPMVAAQESAKLARLLTANGDPAVVEDLKRAAGGLEPTVAHQQVARSITRGLTEAWILEGRVLDQVSDAWERGEAPVAVVDAVRHQLVQIRDAMDDALRGLDALPASDTGEA